MIDQEALKQDFLDLIIQVNGKVRGKVGIPTNADEAAIKNLVLANDNIVKSIGGAEIKKIIIVPNKLVSIVC
jgi:leucyl-tRNA synthetase